MPPRPRNHGLPPSSRLLCSPCCHPPTWLAKDDNNSLQLPLPANRLRMLPFATKRCQAQCHAYQSWQVIVVNINNSFMFNNTGNHLNANHTQLRLLLRRLQPWYCTMLVFCNCNATKSLPRRRLLRLHHR